MIQLEEMKITEQKEIATNIFHLQIQGDLVSQIKQPGQFVHVKVAEGIEPLLRRPISIAKINHEENILSLIYRADGKGTSLLSKKHPGELVSILGPLGNGFPITQHKGKTALLVGGGIGVPPLYELSRQLTSLGIRVIHVLGFQSANVSFLENEFSRLGMTYIATVDGSKGMQGFVTDVIEAEKLTFDCLYACGPTPMLKALEQKFPDKEVYLSLEERMACGIGACFACVRPTTCGDGYKKICSDGPVFRAGEVVL
ncbi:dihydroorotate dehydrogenase electron transfer subunit [Caldibacillus lycopersici]|uniref:Dihydroorotate dehydrogenase B (NAD(+)), electron transfer subunit n=1 Tax=Perspicuibacillus lycopersici TaxID=1325689 RepID=A0AAE3IRP1_9BACI|nr:dihydroorotate dehydrogenase electron transfer subunit [Perspicuibacillus lycopersici]MCU9612171.1 dihydroorotate dehydrogenase electron transfer subunit [Perspicuibacillus lycopersici]